MDGIRQRWAVRPAITGLAQILAGRSASCSRRIEALYLRRRSAWLDFRLIVLSFAMNVVGKRRVRAWMAHPARGPS